MSRRTVKQEFLAQLRKSVGQWVMDVDGKLYPSLGDTEGEKEWARLFLIAYDAVESTASEVEWE